MPPIDELHVDVRDRVGLLTLNRPDVRNALNPELLEGVPATLVELDERDDVDVLVLTGTDPAFCAGLDLKALSSDPRMRGHAIAAHGRHGPFPPLGKPLIGAVNGPAVTGGLEYALACDFLVASDRARFADTHARVGVMPGWGLSVGLPQAVGVRRARQMSFTGNYVDAATAEAWGLVNLVVPHAELLSTVRAIAADIVSNQQAAVQELKATYALTTGTTVEEGHRIEKERAADWQKRFDPAALADRREQIQARGRAQVTD